MTEKKPRAARTRRNVTTDAVALEARRTRAIDLYLRAMTQHEIAEELGVSQKTVSRDIERAREEWRDARKLSIDEWKERELRRIDAIERAAWAGWERSLSTKRVQHQESRLGARTAPAKGQAVGDPPVTGGSIKVRQEEQAGNPAFLERVGWCVDQRCKILGLIAPKKREVRAGMLRADERLERLAALLQVPAETLPS